MAGGPRTNAANSAIACKGTDAETLCSQGLGCSFDYVLIPNSGATLQTGGLKTVDRYCGPQLSPYNAPTPQPVISCELPFTLAVMTNAGDTGGQPGGSSSPGISLSFCFSFCYFCYSCYSCYSYYFCYSCY